MYLGSWFPQPSIVEQADLFIHHGGNNSFCEALYFGVPSLVMPYCWDGHDNAARAAETATGIHMNRSKWDDAELATAMTMLFSDQDMHARLAAISTRMKSDLGTEKAADHIMRVLRPAR